MGFGPSTLTSQPHLLVELEVPLLIPAGFASPGGPLPAGGSEGVYSTDPAFWGGDIANNQVDPPSSQALFTINPDGTTTIVPEAPLLGSVPETASTAWLLAPAMGILAFWRRKLTAIANRTEA